MPFIGNVLQCCVNDIAQDDLGDTQGSPKRSDASTGA